MTPGPLPPHERAWRHPSELAAPAHEPTSRLGHFLIGSTAALSLLLVAWLAISMTPRRYGDADEVRTAASDSAAATPFGLATGSPGDDLTPAERVLRVMSTIFAAQSGQDDSASTVAATFIGDADRPAVTEAVVTPEVAAVPTSVLAPATAPDVADTAAAMETAAIGEVTGDEGGQPASSDAAVLADTTEPLDSSSDPAAPADSSATTTSSTSSTTSTSTTTSSTTTSSTSTTSSTTIAPSSSPKQFS